MANHPKLIAIPGTLLDALERLINTVPTPKTARDKADRQDAARIFRRVRARRSVNEHARRKAKRKAAKKR